MVTRKDSDNDPETIRLPGNIRSLDSQQLSSIPSGPHLKHGEDIRLRQPRLSVRNTPTLLVRYVLNKSKMATAGVVRSPAAPNCSCGFAQRCATISKHYHCTADKSRLDDGYVSSFLENVDLVTTNGTTSTSSDVRPEVIGSKLYDVAFYPPGLRTPDAVTHPLQNTCGHQRDRRSIPAGLYRRILRRRAWDFPAGLYLDREIPRMCRRGYFQSDCIGTEEFPTGGTRLFCWLQWQQLVLVCQIYGHSIYSLKFHRLKPSNRLWDK